MRGRQEADTAPRDTEPDHTSAASPTPALDHVFAVMADVIRPPRRDHPNTVAHSSGAVVCPDEASARRHRDRATWWEHGELVQMDTPTAIYLNWYRAERRWTR